MLNFGNCLTSDNSSSAICNPGMVAKSVAVETESPSLATRELFPLQGLVQVAGVGQCRQRHLSRVYRKCLVAVEIAS